MKFFRVNSNKRKEFPKTREELFKELDMPDNEQSHRALSELMQEGLVEKSERGYCITNPRGVKVVKKIIREKEKDR